MEKWLESYRGAPRPKSLAATDKGCQLRHTSTMPPSG
jgi:hypothetical protein